MRCVLLKFDISKSDVNKSLFTKYLLVFSLFFGPVEISLILISLSNHTQ